MPKARIAIHKFTSCDGCQLAFLNAGEALLIMSELVDIVHFVEAGKDNPFAKVDIAFVEGSISTPADKARILRVRELSQFVITIGACATAGGIQALRNFVNAEQWIKSVYPHPDTIKALATSTAIKDHIKVDCELWGCPVNTTQVMQAIRSLLYKATPNVKRDSLCLECKRLGYVCILVTKKVPCMGPVTQTGCGALCIGVGRDCYACYGPSQNPNPPSLGNRFEQFGLSDAAIANKFFHINNYAPAFEKAGLQFSEKKTSDDHT